MSDVPCAGCRQCCIGMAVIIMPEDEPNLAHYEFREIETPEISVRILKNKPNGECIHLAESGCSIYEHRPVICRNYDCRMQFLVTSRKERRRLKNQNVWREARKRITSLDEIDMAGRSDYHQRQLDTMKQALSTRRNDDAK